MTHTTPPTIGPQVDTATPTTGGETRDLILAAARQILAADGMPGLSMRTLADRLGLSATALYRYFANKQALMDEVVALGFRRFGEYIGDAVDSHPRGSLERLAALGEAYLRFSLENQEYYRIIFSIEASDRRAVEDLPGGGGYALIRECVVDAMEAGAIRRGDPDVVVHFLWSLTHGLVTLELSCRLHEGAGGGGPTAAGPGTASEAPSAGAARCPRTAAGAPLELYRHFHSLVEFGLRGAAGEDPAREAGGGPPR